jgi:hypothetical protein
LRQVFTGEIDDGVYAGEFAGIELSPRRMPGNLVRAVRRATHESLDRVAARFERGRQG